MPRKKFFSNLSSFIFLALFVIILLNPSAKAAIIQGLMKIGFFQPDVDKGHIKLINPVPAGILFKNAQGEIISLQDLKGKVVFINFWATWCPPCQAEMPAIHTLYQRFENNPNVFFLIVSVDDSFAKAKEFIRNKNYSLPIYTPASMIPEELLGESIPTTLIINKKGQVVFRHEGMADFSSPETITLLNRLSK